jgi:hypothetical protein
MHRLLIAVLCIALVGTAVVADQIVSVYVDAQKKDFSPDARVRDGRTYAPLRAAAESVGADVKWMAEQQMAVVCNGPTCVAIKRSDGIIVDDHLLVPLRVLSEAVGCSVTWDGQAKAVRITTADS